MKIIGSLIIFFMMSFSNLYSGEITGAGLVAMNILKSNNIDVAALKSSGHQILFGEHTGAGKRMDLNRINMILTDSELFIVSNADHIEFKHPSQAKALNDVKHIEFGSKVIRTISIKAMVVRNEN